MRQSTDASIYKGVTPANYGASGKRGSASTGGKREPLGTFVTQKEGRRAWRLGRGANFRLDAAQRLLRALWQLDIKIEDAQRQCKQTYIGIALALFEQVPMGGIGIFFLGKRYNAPWFPIAST